mgnify:CR=1 FL=1
MDENLCIYLFMVTFCFFVGRVSVAKRQAYLERAIIIEVSGRLQFCWFITLRIEV